MHRSNRFQIVLLLCSSLVLSLATFAQSSGSAGTIHGVVTDPTGAVVPEAVVEIYNPVSGFKLTTKTDAAGEFSFINVPFNPYHLVVTAKNFAPFTQDVDVRATVPINLQITLKIGAQTEQVIVQGEAKDLIEVDSTPHTDIDRGLFARLPLQSASSSVSSLVTLASPGAVADSNGLVHGIGDHAENSFSVDGQPITDQQSKVFSNQIPIDSIQSLEVISGAPPAEYGEKTSLVIKVTTRSGLGQTKPTGSITSSYGSFGTVSGGLNLAAGSNRWGNFISVSGLQTGRFLDPPEFKVIHAKGNQENIFDRVDFQLSNADSLHINAGFTRSWFQTPNSFDASAVQQDQRVQIRTFNVAPTWTHLFGSTTLTTLGAFVRQDRFRYFPSNNPFADQPETASQQRRLTNAGLRGDISYVKGAHNLKAGITFQHTFLTENFGFGLTDPGVNSPCADSNGNPVADPSFTSPAQCAAAGFQPNTDPSFSAPFAPILGCLDLTRPTPDPADGCSTAHSAIFSFHGHTDIKQISFYIQDTITTGNWSFNLGTRFDIYRGLSRAWQPEPRLGVAYNIKKTNTVLRVSYARILETPFNENLIVSSTNNPVIDAFFGGTSGSPIAPGQRNEFHAGFQQALGRYLVVDGDYLWKYTHNGYDFSDFINTPIFFPIAWHNSKIGGFSIRVSVPNYHGLTAFTVLGQAFSRFFFPQVGGLGSSPLVGVFRIDHDQNLQQTTHVQYQPKKNWPWFAFTWRYDSGLVAGGVPFAADTTTPVDLNGLTADQQVQAGLFCGSTFATLTTPLTSCAPSRYGSTRITLPAPGTEDDDHNPPRVKARHLFDISAGTDNLFHG
ncbi:MAG: TonB-dependent receptor, partial [Candidatus Acidiferrales bacterium]